MSARSFPLNAEVHITHMFVTPCADLFAVRTCSSDLRCEPAVGVEREPNRVEPSGMELSRVELSRSNRVQPVHGEAGVRIVLAVPGANPATRGWGAAVMGEDARAGCQVPGRSQLPLLITD